MVVGYSDDTDNIEELKQQVQTLSIFCRAWYSLPAYPPIHVVTIDTVNSVILSIELLLKEELHNFFPERDLSFELP